MNDIDRQRAAEHLPVSGTLSWLLITDVCLIAEGLGAPGYVSVSSVATCQEAKPTPPSLQSTRLRLAIRSLIRVDRCRLSLSSVARKQGNKTGPDSMVATEENDEVRQ